MSSSVSDRTPEAGPLFAVRFDPAAVVCSSGRVDDALRCVRDLARGAGQESSQVRARDVLATLPALSDVDAVYRHLLAHRRVAHGRAHSTLSTALDGLREHSNLYTPRQCVCLRMEWRRFVANLEREVLALFGSSETWVVSVDDAPAPDKLGSVTTEMIGELVGLGRDGMDASSRTRRLPRIEVVATEVTRGEFRVIITYTKGHRTHVTTLQSLPQERNWLATVLRYTEPHNRCAGHRVAQMSAELVRTVDALAGVSTATAHAAVDELEEVGFDALPEAHRRVGVRLARGWTGTVRELVEVAGTVAA